LYSQLTTQPDEAIYPEHAISAYKNGTRVGPSNTMWSRVGEGHLTQRDVGKKKAAKQNSVDPRIKTSKNCSNFGLKIS